MRCKPCRISVRAAALALAASIAALAQAPQPAVASGRRYPRLIVRNATVIEGNGTPAAGPKDIVIENGQIAEIVPIDPGAAKKPDFKRPEGGVELDATGKYVMPGLINLHGHVQEERGGIKQPLDYELKLWLACGITTVRDVGSELDRTLALRRESAEGTVAAPRIFVYPFFNKPRRRAMPPKPASACASSKPRAPTASRSSTFTAM